MAKYNVWDGDGGTRPFNSIETAGRYAYASMKKYMDKWRDTVELETRMIWGKDHTYIGIYFGRLHYKEYEFSYFWDGKKMHKLRSDGSLTALTPKEKAIIKKVENNPKNW